MGLLNLIKMKKRQSGFDRWATDGGFSGGFQKKNTGVFGARSHAINFFLAGVRAAGSRLVQGQ